MTDRPTLLFVATEDWFFASHFLPMARAAAAMGLDVAVAARMRRDGPRIEAAGARLLPIDMARGTLDPRGSVRAVRDLRRIIAAERPAIVHCISLRAMLVGGLAARGLPGVRLVQAMTGLGFAGALGGPAGGAIRGGFRLLLRRLIERPGTRYLFENEEDARWLGLAPDDPAATFVPGAGVDPDEFPATPLPPPGPLRVALVARMLWSKGVDTAVEAVSRARAGGADIRLSLYGAPDPGNPRAIPEATLRDWSAREGIAWHGRSDDIAAVWAAQHVACLPSRGGEGLPRALLEAASCGRAVVTSDTPGCSRLVRDGVEGLLVPPGNVDALAAALTRLAGDRALLEALGTAAAARVRAGFTEADVAAGVTALYQRILDERAAAPASPVKEIRP